MQGIYSIWNYVSGKRYIGSAVNIERRLMWHRSVLKQGKHHNEPLQRAWQKYGSGAFSFATFEIVEDESKLFEREQFWIESIPYGLLYNTCHEAGRPPRMKGRRLSGQTKALMSEAHRGRKHTPEDIAKMRAAWRPRHTPESLASAAGKLRGRKLSPEHRAKVVAALDKSRGRKLTDETKAKLSAANSGRKHSPEARARMSAAGKGRPKSAQHRANISAAMAARKSVIDRASGIVY